MSPSVGINMKSGVAVYGGFDPDNGITDLTHKRILPNEGTHEGSVLNGYNMDRVIRNIYTESDPMPSDKPAILDGFTIKNGVTNYAGGGIYNTYASAAVFRNLVVTNNTAELDGAGVYNEGCSPEFTNVIIKDNQLTLHTGICRGARRRTQPDGQYPDHPRCQRNYLCKRNCFVGAISKRYLHYSP